MLLVRKLLLLNNLVLVLILICRWRLLPRLLHLLWHSLRYAVVGLLIVGATGSLSGAGIIDVQSGDRAFIAFSQCW